MGEEENSYCGKNVDWYKVSVRGQLKYKPCSIMKRRDSRV